MYDIGNGLVLKVAKSKYGIRSNRTEAKIYKLTPSRLKKHLGKLFKHMDNWLIMKRYDRQFPKTKKYKRKLKKLKSRFKKKGIIAYEIFSRMRKRPNRNNLRLDSDGRIIVIDYGNFVRKRRKRGSA